MTFIDILGRYKTLWSGSPQDDIPTDLLKTQVSTWDLYTEIVKDRDYTGEVVGEKVEIELRIYVQRATYSIVISNLSCLIEQIGIIKEIKNEFWC